MREHEQGMLAKPSPVSDQIDNLVIYTTPLPHKVGDELWLAMLAASDKDKGEIADVLDTLPPAWKGRYTVHLIPCAPIVNGEVALPGDISHVAMLQSIDQRTEGGAPFLFGADWIVNDGVMMMYSQTSGKFFFFHCRKCCYITLSYMIEQQSAWHAKAGPWRVGNTMN